MKDKKNIELVIFDFDGTLADTFSYIIKNFDDVSKLVKGKDIKKERIGYYKSLHIKELMKEFEINKFELFFMLLKMRFIMYRYMRKIPPHENIEEVLKRLKKKGFRLGILTSNSWFNVHKFLRLNGITRLFEFIRTDPQLFLKDRKLKKILRKYKLEPGKVLYIGDEGRDIEAGNNVGIRVIGVTWGYNDIPALKKHNPYRIAHTPDELYDIILRA